MKVTGLGFMHSTFGSWEVIRDLEASSQARFLQVPFTGPLACGLESGEPSFLYDV
jgi:hypothetical protein